MENFWGISLEMVQSPELYQLLDYVPLFDNLRFESFIDRNYGTLARDRQNSFYSKNESQDPHPPPDDDLVPPGFGDSTDLMKESLQDSLDPQSCAPDDSSNDFGGDDFGVYGFDEESQHVLVRPKQPRQEFEKLALKFTKMHEGINYLEVEKYLEAVVELLGEVGFEEFPELVSLGDFCILGESMEKRAESGEDAEHDEERSADYRVINRLKLEGVEFKIKDQLNDLMENASLTNILMDLSKVQNKFLVQSKSKLNFLNTLIYSVDFSELMSLLFEYTIKMYSDEIDEEGEDGEDGEEGPADEEDKARVNRKDVVVFLIMKLQFKILLGLAELRLFELFHRELNLKFEEIKVEKMEKMRMEIKEQISMYFSKPVVANFSIMILSKRISVMLKASDRAPVKLGKLEELDNRRLSSPKDDSGDQGSLILMERTKSQADFLEGEEEEFSCHPDTNLSQGSIEPVDEEPKTPVKQPLLKSLKALINMSKADENSSLKNESLARAGGPGADPNESIRRARENLDELISIKQMVNDTNTNFSVSETSDATLLNLLKIPFGIQKIIKSQIRGEHAKQNATSQSALHIKSKSNNFVADPKTLLNLEKEFEKMMGMGSNRNLSREIVSGICKQIKENNCHEDDSKISSIIIENLVNHSKSFFSQDKGPRINLSEIEKPPDHLGKDPLPGQSTGDNPVTPSKEEPNQTNDAESEDRTVTHTQRSLTKSHCEHPRDTSKRETSLLIQKLHEERPTFKYQKTGESAHTQHKSDSGENTAKPPTQVETVEYFFQKVPLESVLEHFKSQHQFDLIKFNDVEVVWTNFERLLAQLGTRFPNSRLKSESGESNRKRVERELRKYRSRIVGMKCRIMKVHNKYISFFDKNFHSIIKDFSDVDYMRRQINLLMKNNKFHLIDTKENVQVVRFKKPIYMNKLILKNSPFFR